ATTASTVTTGTISTGAPRLAAASRRDTTASLVATAPLAATAATATGVAACRASAGGGILTTGIVGPASRRLGVTAARRASARRADLHDAAHAVVAEVDANVSARGRATEHERKSEPRTQDSPQPDNFTEGRRLVDVRRCGRTSARVGLRRRARRSQQSAPLAAERAVRSGAPAP